MYVPTVRVMLVKTIKLQPTENAVVDVRVWLVMVLGVWERGRCGMGLEVSMVGRCMGDGVGGSELLTDSWSCQVCDGPPLLLLEQLKRKWESRYQTPIQRCVRKSPADKPTQFDPQD